MKKLLLLVPSLLLAVSINAQFYVGGTISFKSVDVPTGSVIPLSDKTSTTSFTIEPEIGYAFNEKWAAGITFTYSSSDLYQKTNGNVGGFLDDTSSAKLDKSFSVLGVSPYARFTCLRTKMVDLFLDGGLAYMKADNGSYVVDAFAIGIQPGVSLNFNEHFSFVAKLGSVGYTVAKSNIKDTKALHEFTFDISSFKNIQFGMYYHF